MVAGHVLEQRSARTVHRHPPGTRGEEAALVVEAEVARGVDEQPAGGDEILPVPREQVLYRGATGLLEGVWVAGLRDAVTGDRLVGQFVALDERDPLERVREDAGRQETGHARTDDDRVLPDEVDPSLALFADQWPFVERGIPGLEAMSVRTDDDRVLPDDGDPIAVVASDRGQGHGFRRRPRRPRPTTVAIGAESE